MFTVYTASVVVDSEQYVSERGEDVTMSVTISSQGGPVSVEVETPTRGTKPVTTCSTIGGNSNEQSCSYTVSNVNYEMDRGQYVFKVFENVSNSYNYTATDTATLQGTFINGLVKMVIRSCHCYENATTCELLVITCS